MRKVIRLNAQQAQLTQSRRGLRFTPWAVVISGSDDFGEVGGDEPTNPNPRGPIFEPVPNRNRTL